MRNRLSSRLIDMGCQDGSRRTVKRDTVYPYFNPDYTKFPLTQLGSLDTVPTGRYQSDWSVYKKKGLNMTRPNQKEAILEAAQAIVSEEGAMHMTLDAVAARCKMSKGGLMYNFPTKEALIEAMVQRLMERHEELREKIREEALGEKPVGLMLEIMMMMQLSEADHRFSSALLVALANRPERMRKVKDAQRERFLCEIASPEHFESSAILFFAALGLHFQKLLNVSLVDEEQEQRVFAELLRRAAAMD